MSRLVKDLYGLARLVNDIEKFASGRLLKRLLNKLIGRKLAKFFWIK